MAVHTEDQRVFIVRRLAVFDAPEEIIADFKRAWPTTNCEPIDIAANDPRRGLTDEKLIAVFNSRRAVEMKELERLWPSMSETLQITLRRLTRREEKLHDHQAYDLANKTAAEIAKIVSGFYASKGGAANVPAVAGDEPITSITRTIIDSAVPAIRLVSSRPA